MPTRCARRGTVSVRERTGLLCCPPPPNRYSFDSAIRRFGEGWGLKQGFKLLGVHPLHQVLVIGDLVAAQGTRGVTFSRELWVEPRLNCRPARSHTRHMEAGERFCAEPAKLVIGIDHHAVS